LFCPAVISELAQTSDVFDLEIIKACRSALFSTVNAQNAVERFGNENGNFADFLSEK